MNFQSLDFFLQEMRVWFFYFYLSIHQNKSIYEYASIFLSHRFQFVILLMLETEKSAFVLCPWIFLLVIVDFSDRLSLKMKVVTKEHYVKDNSYSFWYSMYLNIRVLKGTRRKYTVVTILNASKGNSFMNSMSYSKLTIKYAKVIVIEW